MYKKSLALHSFVMLFNYSKNKQGSLGTQRRYMFNLLDYVELRNSSSTYPLIKPKYVFPNFTPSVDLAFKKLLIAQTLKWPIEVYHRNYFLPFRSHNFPSLLSFESEKVNCLLLKILLSW